MSTLVFITTVYFYLGLGWVNLYYCDVLEFIIWIYLEELFSIGDVIHLDVSNVAGEEYCIGIHYIL